MRRAPALVALCAALCASGAATAQDLQGADLVRELSGNTLTGYNGSLWFSEYHAPDGRVLGHNATMRNRDACWQVRGDAVCYYYPRERIDGQSGRLEFCWRFARAGSEGYRMRAVGSASQGFAKLDPGNARNHGDDGQTWTCEALLARRDRGRRVASTEGLPGQPTGETCSARAAADSASSSVARGKFSRIANSR